MAKKKNKKIKTSFILILLIAIFILSSLIVIILNIAPKENKLNSKSEPVQLNQDPDSETDLIIDKEKFCEQEGPEMLEFIEKLQASMDKSAQAMGQRGEIVKTWPNWTKDEENQFIYQGSLITQAYQEVKNLYPPDKFISLHNKISEALRLWSEGAEIGNQGFINQNNDQIQECLQLTAEGNNYIKAFKEELNELNLN